MHNSHSQEFEKQRSLVIDRFSKIFSSPSKKVREAEIEIGPGKTTRAQPLNVEDARRLAQSLESHIHELSERADTADKQYNAKARRLLFNLNHNPFLWYRASAGELSPEALVELSNEDLARKSATEEPQVHEIEVETSGPEGIKTSLYACPSCGGSEVYESPMHAGSALFACGSCGTKWKLPSDMA